VAIPYWIGAVIPLIRFAIASLLGDQLIEPDADKFLYFQTVSISFARANTSISGYPNEAAVGYGRKMAAAAVPNIVGAKLEELLLTWLVVLLVVLLVEDGDLQTSMNLTLK
jgi:hypothetical protein